jgi:LmbE family N-acetylglucosaminyl deacetylase
LLVFFSMGFQSSPHAEREDNIWEMASDPLEVHIMSRQPSRMTSRRELLAGLGVGAAALGLPLVEAVAADGPVPQRKVKVLVAGAHPDDPELSVGGTIARYTDLGHEVVCLYLTRGEMGVLKEKKTPEETAALRSAEAEKACVLLKARPLFAGQLDADTEVNPGRYDAFFKVLAAVKPDVVFTHWPIDPHRDHRATSLLVYDAWLKSGRTFQLYYFEVKSGLQTQMFRPTFYVDITATEERKRKACYLHSHGEQVYTSHTDLMNRFRGLECGCRFAEAFVHHPNKAAGPVSVG